MIHHFPACECHNFIKRLCGLTRIQLFVSPWYLLNQIKTGGFIVFLVLHVLSTHKSAALPPYTDELFQIVLQ